MVKAPIPSKMKFKILLIYNLHLYSETSLKSIYYNFESDIKWKVWGILKNVVL